ncbi:zf-TFIIB domain-containing protein [bacterium]|nr:zf-TFIIB domain-containing protein [bacterium]
MKCGKCDGDFTQYQCGNMKISYCKDCKSVWIKYSALKKISELLDLKSEILNPAEMEAIKVKEEARLCPECGKPADKVYFNGVILDKCSACDGILFDDGELAKFFRIYMKRDPGVIGNIEFLDKYCKNKPVSNKEPVGQEIEIQSKEKEKRVISFNGFAMVFVLLLLLFVSFIFTILNFGIIGIPGFILFVVALPGFKLLKPQEAMVLTVFGKYIGTLKGAGFHYVNPFATSVTLFQPISLKARTLDNGRQKINDEIGNPIEVGIIVIWEVQDTAKAIFNVDDYTKFLSSQSDSALRNIVRMYPYDAQEDSGKTSLRGDSQEISQKLKEEIQRNVKVAGLNIIDAKITHLAYAPEIAVAMLQRQQASAVIDAKKAIVEGAVGMVEMALARLNDNNVVSMDNAEKVKMVNDLLVILCSGKEAQPVVKSGS